MNTVSVLLTHDQLCLVTNDLINGEERAARNRDYDLAKRYKETRSMFEEAMVRAMPKPPPVPLPPQVVKTLDSA